MNTNALRQKILDLAIHGKLVKQDPADEPASVMLEKLRAEKEAKIAAGEIKRNKNDSYIFKYTGTSGENKTDDNPEGLEHNRHYEKFADGRVKDIEDEIPFAVPEGWAWCRFKDIVTYIDDGDWIESKEQSDFGIRLLQTGNIGCGYFKDKEGNYHYISEETFKKLNCNEIYPGDILISRLPEPVGRACIVPNLSQRLITAVDCAIIRLKQDIISKNYFIYYTQSAKYLELIKNNCMGTTRLRISRANLEKTLLPLPPLIEQHRIVTAIEAIFTQIDLLEQNKADLQTAVKQAKSKILDLAIHGELVPQAPADEPASVMLERLRAEKEAKIVAGEMKRGKNDSYIYKNSTDNCYYEKFDGESDVCIDNEIPFELPANWQWQRGKEIFCPMTTKIPSGHNFKYVDIDAIDNKTHRIRCSKLIEVSKAPSRASREVQNGDILFSLVRPYLKNIALVLENYSDCIASTGFYVCRPNKALISKYAFYMMTSQYVVNGLNKFMKGDNSPSITGDNIIKWLYPLPPISEQKRIVARIEEIFNALDDIQSNLV